MTIESDQALVMAAHDLRRDKRLFQHAQVRAQHPDELTQPWEQHPETPYIVQTVDGVYVLSTYPEALWPERGSYGRAYLTAAEAIARHVVETHNAGLGE